MINLDFYKKRGFRCKNNDIGAPLTVKCQWYWEINVMQLEQINHFFSLPVSGVWPLHLLKLKHFCFFHLSVIFKKRYYSLCLSWTFFFFWTHQPLFLSTVMLVVSSVWFEKRVFLFIFNAVTQDFVASVNGGKRFMTWKWCMCVHGNKLYNKILVVPEEDVGETLKKKPSVCALSEFSLHVPVGVIWLCRCFESNFTEGNIQLDKYQQKTKKSIFFSCFPARLIYYSDNLW